MTYCREPFGAVAVQPWEFDDASTCGVCDLEHLRTIKNLLAGIFIIFMFGAIYFARDMFLPIVIALLLALTLSPLVRFFEKLGVAVFITSTVLIVGTAVMLFVGAYFLSGPVATMVAEIPDVGDALRVKLGGVMASIQDVQDASAQVEEMATGGDTVPKVAIAQPGLLAFAAGSVANFLSLTAVGLVLALFILASGDLFYVKLVEAFPSFSDKRRAVKTVRAVERQVSRYFLTITTINAGLGVAVGLAMWAIGLRNPVLWGVLAFTLNFLPFLGALVGIAIVAAIGILTFDSIGAGLLPAGAYLLLTAIEGQFVTPHVLGRRLELNTVSVFITVIVWSWLWTIPGALMAVPFLVVLKVICDNVAGWSVLGSFLGARAPIIEEATQSSPET